MVPCAVEALLRRLTGLGIVVAVSYDRLALVALRDLPVLFGFVVGQVEPDAFDDGLVEGRLAARLDLDECCGSAVFVYVALRHGEAFLSELARHVGRADVDAGGDALEDEAKPRLALLRRGRLYYRGAAVDLEGIGEGDGVS